MAIAIIVMAIAIMWIVVDVMNIITSVLDKETHESKGKTAYWDGMLCGLNIILILVWVYLLCGVVYFAE